MLATDTLVIMPCLMSRCTELLIKLLDDQEIASYTCKIFYTHTQADTGMHTHVRTHTHTHRVTNTHTHTTRTHTHTTRTHTHTHHTHTHTHCYMHTQSQTHSLSSTMWYMYIQCIQARRPVTFIIAQNCEWKPK